MQESNEQHKKVLDAIVKIHQLHENIPTSEHCELLETDGNVAKYRFMKEETTAAKLIEELSGKAMIQDISVEETGIEDIIRIAYKG